MSGPRIKAIALALFLGAIVAANYVTARYGLIPVGFGLVTTAGTYFAGVTFIARDAIQDTAGPRWVIGGIIAGAALSAFVSPSLAVASGVAFLCSESADFAIYTPLRERGYVRAAIASNVVGSFVDTVVFLWLAGFPLWSSVPGQMVAKLAVTGVVIVAVATLRARRAVTA